MSFFTNLSDTFATSPWPHYLAFLGFSAFTLGSAIYASFRYLVRARTLEDVPTSLARSAEQGYVELEGVAEMLEGPRIKSPVSGRECVWWSYVLEEYDDGWKQIEQESSEELFAVRDETGICIVDPDGADVFPVEKRTWAPGHRAVLRTLPGLITSKRQRFREFYLMEHEFITVIGFYRTHKAIDTWDDAEELRALLAEWKRNQPELINRFDRNNDGVLDQEEWNIAREEARKQLAREKREHAVRPGVNVIGAPNDRRPFLIAPHANDDFAGKLRRKALISLGGSFIAAAAFLFLINARFL